MSERLNMLKFQNLIFSCFIRKDSFLIVLSALSQVSSSPTCKLVVFLTWCLAMKLKIKAITTLLLLQKQHHLVPASARMSSFPETKESLSRAKIEKLQSLSELTNGQQDKGPGLRELHASDDQWLLQKYTPKPLWCFQCLSIHTEKFYIWESQIKAEVINASKPMLRPSMLSAYNVHIDILHCKEMLYFIKTLRSGKPSWVTKMHITHTHQQLTQVEHI